jgi:hypothetical protein
MELKHHKTLSFEKWKTFTFSRQVLMIANELNRAGVWIGKSDLLEAKLCYERALELIWLTVPGVKNIRKLRELLRLRGVLALRYLDVPADLNENKKMMNALLLLDKDSYNLLNPALK